MIEIRITGDNARDTITELAAFGLHCMNDPAIAPEPLGEPTPEKPSSKETKKAAKSAAEDKPAPFGRGKSSESPTTSPSEEEEEEPIPLIEDVRAKARAAAQEYGQAAVKSVLESYGSPSVTALPKEDRAAFMKDLERLGEESA